MRCRVDAAFACAVFNATIRTADPVAAYLRGARVARERHALHGAWKRARHTAQRLARLVERVGGSVAGFAEECAQLAQTMGVVRWGAQCDLADCV